MVKVLVIKSFDAMKIDLLRILTYPILQVLVYCSIVTGSVYFYGPLVLVHGLGVLHFQWNALLGIAGILLVLLSTIRRFQLFQLWGTLLMLTGIVPHLSPSIHGIQQITLTHPVSLVLIPLFCLISLFVLIRFYLLYRKQ
ncbi:MAG: hypothetical protein KGZ90_02760, partial [Algoriphagus sp.]|nr:hypothetical protein [Algoriphagus sp.]